MKTLKIMTIIRKRKLMMRMMRLVPHDRGSRSISAASDRDAHFTSPAVEIVPLKVVQTSKYEGEQANRQGLHEFKVFPWLIIIVNSFVLLNFEILQSEIQLFD